MKNINILKPDIRNHHIENLETIISELNNVNDSEFIINFIDELESYISDYPEAVIKEETECLLQNLKRRNLEINPDYKETISYENFVELFKKLYSGMELTEIENQNIEDYVKASVRKLENGILLPDAHNALDNYMLYLKEKNITNEQLERYDAAIKKLKEASLKTGTPKKVYFIKQINTQGRVNTIATIEITILAGILISLLLLLVR